LNINHAAAAAILVLLAGCAETSGAPDASFGGRQVLSTLVGAGAGGLVGNQFGRGSGKAAMTGLGTLAGGAAGLYLSQPPQPKPYAAQQPAYGYQQQGYQQPPAVYQPQPVCREMASAALINGRAEQVNGVACLNQNGTWTRIQ
jgi:surface antigen